MTALSPGILLYKAGDSVPRPPVGGLALPHLPSTAFGDGSHPTTRLCAGAVDLLCRQSAPRTFLDVGTGTGILVRIARARGVPWAVGTDIDSTALQAARKNMQLDLPSGEITLSSELPDHWGEKFELVVANILEGPLKELASRLVRALRPKGTLLLSGFTPLQTPGLRVTFESCGLHYLSESTLQEWSLLLFEKPTL